MVEISVDIPPNISFIYEFAFERAKMDPMYIICDIVPEILELIENETNKIIEIKDWKKRSEIRFLNQDLKIHEEELFTSVIKENGLSNINTLIMMNRIEYENRREISPKLAKLLIIPSKENRLKVSVPWLIYWFIWDIKELKEMGTPHMFSSTARRKSVIYELISNMKSIIEYE